LTRRTKRLIILTIGVGRANGRRYKG
jgi:hypothetical protein